jgi:hypothetical protein
MKNKDETKQVEAAKSLNCLWRASPHQKHGRRRSGRVASGLCSPQVKLCHLAYAYRHQFGADASPQAPRLAKSTSMIPSTRMGTTHLGTCPIPPRIPRSVASSASVTNLCETFREVIELAHFPEHSMNQTAQDHAYLHPCSKRPPVSCQFFGTWNDGAHVPRASTRRAACLSVAA